MNNTDSGIDAYLALVYYSYAAIANDASAFEAVYGFKPEFAITRTDPEVPDLTPYNNSLSTGLWDGRLRGRGPPLSRAPRLDVHKGRGCGVVRVQYLQPGSNTISEPGHVHKEGLSRWGLLRTSACLHREGPNPWPTPLQA